ncbi:helix-turn-helix domain-containing protein [Halanaeroarchaeum sulfurireducens]|uniref:helix-turn-helix domain-containing protein n=1 Tax=Halanaeroarchaeum sulfurireducens TaxID=1604004 RepID=UPI001F16DC38|nr:helix-turn-helix domain-containing protein [Halanaeroarchaeum sulfurireducens]
MATIDDMAIQQTPKSLPGELQSPRGKLIYLYLVQSDGATLSDLKEHLDLGALTLYSVLKTLRERGLVRKDDDRFVTARPV